MLGAPLNPVNSSIIAVSLVPTGVALGAPPSQTAWLVSALYLATAVGQSVADRLVDRHGARRLYLAGAGLVVAGGALGTVAPTLPVLVVARVVLGLGTCAGSPAAMSLIRGEALRTGTDRPQGALALLAASAQTVAVLGPPLGGLLMSVGGWRATFAVNVPLGLACLVLGWLLLPRGPAARSDASPPGRLDLPGILLFSVALVALLLFLAEPDPDRWWLPAGSAVAAAGLVVRELRAADPFLDLRVLARNGPLLATYARALVAQCAAYAWFFGFPQWLQDARGLGAAQTGLLLTLVFGVAIVVTAVTGRRRGVRAKLLVGAGAQAAVAGLLLTLGPGSDVRLLLGISLLAGLPLGLIGLANQNAVYAQADAAPTGTSAGLLRTSSCVGAIASAAALGVAYPDRADTAGLHALAFLVLGLAGLLVLLVALDRSLGRVGRGGAADPPAPAAPVSRRTGRRRRAPR